MEEDDQQIATRPASVRAAQTVFFLNALIWLAFGVVSLLRLSGGDGDDSVTLLVIAILMFGNVIAMTVAGLGLGKQSRLFYYFALAVLLINILLTFTDEFGAFDAITLAIDLLLLGLLLISRKRYLLGHDQPEF